MGFKCNVKKIAPLERIGEFRTCFGIQGNTSWRCYDLFGGALCVRQSWHMIESAANHLWGIKCGLTHTFTVAHHPTIVLRFLKVFSFLKDSRFVVSNPRLKKHGLVSIWPKRTIRWAVSFQISCSWSRTPPEKTTGHHPNWSWRDLMNASSMKTRTSSQHMFLWCDCAILNFSRVWGHRVSIQVDPICAGAQLLWEMTVVALLGVRAFSSPGTNLSSTNQVYFSGPRSQLFLIQVCFKVWSEGRLRESQEEASSWCCYYVHAPNPCECAWECSWFWRGQELLGLCLWSLSLSAFCFSPSPGRNIWRSTSHGIRSKQPRGELGESRIRLDISPPLSPNAFWGCAHDSSGIQTPANGVGELCMTLPRRNGPVYTLCKRYLKWSLHLEIVSWIWILQHTMWQPQSNVKTRQSMKLNFPGENISTKTASVPLKRIWSFGVHMLKKEFLK